MSELYPHTATVWYKNTEERKATWERALCSPCRMETTRGAIPGTAGDSSSAAAMLIAPAGSVPSRLAKGDKVAIGAHLQEQPTDDAHVIETCKPVRLGTNVHHWEFELR